jgi:hypothetical protein
VEHLPSLDGETNEKTNRRLRPTGLGDERGREANHTRFYFTVIQKKDLSPLAFYSVQLVRSKSCLANEAVSSNKESKYHDCVFSFLSERLMREKLQKLNWEIY